MVRSTTASNLSARSPKISLRKLNRELKLIPHDIRREMRYLDLLLLERSSSVTEVEKTLIKELIEQAKKQVKVHQERLWRYEQCHKQMQETKSYDIELLKPDELEVLRKAPTRTPSQKSATTKTRRRTGTDG